MSVETVQRVCETCNHRALTRPRKSAAVYRWLGLRVPAARCTERVFDVSGLGSMPCDCQDPCHGS